MKRTLRAGAIALGLASFTGCTAQEWMSQELHWFIDVTEPTRHVLSDEQLERLRWCESTDNYRAISPQGWYRGAYQFDFRTWNDVASRHYPWLVDLDPIDVEYYWQDAMARALYAERGAEPWPVCGRRL